MYEAVAMLVVALLGYVAYLQVRLRRCRYDRLTGVLTRGSWDRAAQRALRRAAMVVVLDVDEFKSINDRHGHLAGDQLLSVLGQRLQAYAGWHGVGAPGRSGFVVGRLGGDEFGAVASEATEVETLRARLAEPIEIQGRAVSISVSIGSAPVVPGLSLEALVSRADQVMYKRKRDGKSARTTAAGTVPA